MMLVQQPHIKSTPLYHPTIADTICDRDAIINARTQHITRANTNSLPKPKHHYNNIHTITSFISINDSTNPNLSPLSFKHTNHYNLFNFSFLSSPLPSFRHCTTNLSKPPNTYHEALTQLDKEVWILAIKQEIDSLEECKAFKRTQLPEGRKAIGIRWTYDYCQGFTKLHSGRSEWTPAKGT
jgi:hypothetical protein